MDENLDRGINENDRILDLHEGTTHRSGHKKVYPEGVHGSKYDSSRSPSQRRFPDGFTELSGNDQSRAPRSGPASNVWSPGVANWRASDTRSTSNKNISDSTALIKEPGNPPTTRDTTESAPAHSRDQLHHSRILSFLGSEDTPASSFEADHLDQLARTAIDSFVTVFDEIPDHKNEPLPHSLENPMAILASEIGARDHSSKIESQKLRSTISGSVSMSPTRSRGGKEYESLMDADDVSLHAGRAKSTIASHMEIEDGLLGLGLPKKTSLADPPAPDSATGPVLVQVGAQDYFSPSNDEIRVHRGNHLKYQKTTYSPAPRLPLSEPRFVTPISPTNERRVQHPKSLSAEAPAFNSSPPSSLPMTPTRSSNNGHGRSVSLETGQSNPTYVSVMSNTPLRHHSLRPSQQSTTGTTSIPVETGVFKNSGGASQSVIYPQFPEPHQHTPEVQGQYFDTQGSMPPQMPTQFYDSLRPNMPPFSSHMHSLDNSTIHYNAQIDQQGEQNAEYSQSNHFDSYATSQAANAAPDAADLHPNGNIYAQDTNGYGPRYYSNHTDPSHQLNHNLYSPLEPHREPSKPNQRTGKDMFILEDLRLKLFARTEATLRVFAVTNIPAVDPYHTLTPLTTVNQQQSQTFRGYSSITYKAVSAKDGRTYCLRRIQDFQATNLNEKAILAVRQKWNAVKNSNVVALHSAFTTSNFDDSSLVVVSDYHPDSKTVAEKHLSSPTLGRPNRNPPPISEQTLWSYVVQITNALKAVHSAQLAVRIIEPTKVIVTDEDRIRLNGCALEDLLDGEVHDIADLQRLDFHKFGNFILALGTSNISNSSHRARGPDVFAQNYSKINPKLKTVVEWLLNHDRPENDEGIDVLINLVSSNAIDAFNRSLHSNDQLYFSLNKEIENSRIVRLMTKLNCVNDRPEYEHDRTYSTQGSRTVLGLFRDYVFHQVDAQANPVVDMGHILSCLNKLDAGIEERIALTARDEQSVIVVSYKELKGALEGTWQELMRRSTG
ncbi:MAG: PAB-dependent poly(A)-specific ribonuclease subunit 3 [Alectoria sarmentosa]|nr:MAG: PAB-dependent poly(A)-specific ribonuclease subunit 3 [Alectoria sarmentosa]